MIIPVNIKLKHWILACIDFEEKWIAWLDSIGDTHEQETRLLFTWLTREHSVNRPSVFEPAEWSIHSVPPQSILLVHHGRSPLMMPWMSGYLALIPCRAIHIRCCSSSVADPAW